MNRAARIIVIAVVVAVAATIGYLYLADRTTPEGQPPLVEMTLDAFDQLKADFNQDQGRARIIALLSPT